MIEKVKLTVSLDTQTLDWLGFIAMKAKTSRSQMLRSMIMDKASWDDLEEMTKYANEIKQNKMD